MLAYLFLQKLKNIFCTAWRMIGNVFMSKNILIISNLYKLYSRLPLLLYAIISCILGYCMITVTQ